MGEVGSSPHTRDKCIPFHGLIIPKGITPAYAGQIVREKSTGNRTGDHPRIRGTNDIVLDAEVVNEGSPPHTRDKFQSRGQVLALWRITPAYAGQIPFCG